MGVGLGWEGGDGKGPDSFLSFATLRFFQEQELTAAAALSCMPI